MNETNFSRTNSYNNNSFGLGENMKGYVIATVAYEFLLIGLIMVSYLSAVAQRPWKECT